MRRRARAMLTGAVIGTTIAVAGLLAARAFTPAVHTAYVLLVVPEQSAQNKNSPEALRTLQSDVRDELARRIHGPTLLPRIVRETDVATDAAAEFSRSLRVIALQERPSFVALGAEADDPQALSVLLDATANALLLAHRQRALLAQDDRIQALEAMDAQIVAQDQTAAEQLGGVVLPTWARASATALGLLDARKFAASLAPVLGRAPTASEVFDLTRAEEDIAALSEQIGGTPAVTASQFAAARRLASTSARRAHLARARQEVLDHDPSADGPQVVQYAQPVAVPPPKRRLLWIALVGGSIGALSGFVMFTGRPETGGSRDGPTLESHLHVRVLGNMATALNDYARRKNRPLAQTHPDHLAVEAVRSLATGLSVVRASASRSGPVIMVDADDDSNAGHVLANLAMLAAVEDERVLLIDTQGSGSVLADLFTTGTRTMLSTSVDVQELGAALPKRKSGGRIRFVVADDPESDDPPVPGAFASYFDRIYIRAHSIAAAARLAACYEGASGVLVAHHSLPIRAWQEARDQWRDQSESLVGLVQCGHNIKESAYHTAVT